VSGQGGGRPAFLGPLPKVSLWFRIGSWLLGKRWVAIDGAGGVAVSGRTWRGVTLVTDMFRHPALKDPRRDDDGR